MTTSPAVIALTQPVTAPLTQRTVILDVADLSIRDPVDLEDRINAIPGVVTVGLFARRGADVVLIGPDSGIDTITPHRA